MPSSTCNSSKSMHGAVRRPCSYSSGAPSWDQSPGLQRHTPSTSAVCHIPGTTDWLRPGEQSWRGAHCIAKTGCAAAPRQSPVQPLCCTAGCARSRAYAPSLAHSYCRVIQMMESYFSTCTFPCVAEHCPLRQKEEARGRQVLLRGTGAPAAQCKGADVCRWSFARAVCARS